MIIFYHIEVMDLPFHTILFVSCFINITHQQYKKMNLHGCTCIENLHANLG